MSKTKKISKKDAVSTWIIGYPPCSTCKKSEKLLQEMGIDYHYRNIKTEAPSAQELKEWMNLSALPFAKWFNSSGQLYRERALSAQVKTMSETEALRLMDGNGMLVKRPILLAKGKVLLGFNEKKWRELLETKDSRGDVARQEEGKLKLNENATGGETNDTALASSGSLPRRDELPQEMCWDLTKLFKSDAAWEKAFKAYVQLVEKTSSPAGQLAEGAEFLLAACRYYESLSRPFETLYAYAHMKHDSDTADSKYTAMQSRALSLYVKTMAKLAFFKPELNGLADERLAQYFTELPELEHYRQMIEESRLGKEHILSDAEELLLARSGRVLKASAETYSILSNADLQFEALRDENGQEVELTNGRYVRFLESRDRTVREEAFKKLYKTYKQFGNTFASLISGNVNAQNFQAQTRKYKSAREAALFNNSIPEKVYDNLLKTVQKNLPLLHRFVALRKRILAVDTLHAYDLYAPLTSIDMKITFEEAKKITLKALAPLGERYLEILRRAFSERWIDVLENKGKRSGAYSGGCYDSVPYILLNWHDSLDDLFTLVHELGHSVHSYLTRANQPYVYGDYSIFLAEIASTTNENLLTAYLLENEKDPEKRRHYIHHYLDGFKGTVFRQTQFAQFEQLIHQADLEGKALTVEFLTEAYGRINQDYYGPALEKDPEIAYEWARIPHFYYNFYVYQYATGFSAATAFARSILDGKKGAVEKYLDFLAAGRSDYPLNVLKKAGLDMSKPQPIEIALQTFEHYLQSMENWKA